MRMRSAPFTPVLTLLLIYLWSPHPVSTVLMNLEGYTFRVIGKSYVEYRPEWTDISNFGFRFSFRTFMPTTFLVHHTFLAGGSKGGSQLQPHVWVRLKKGEIHVTHQYQEYEEVVSAGRGKRYIYT